MFVPDSTEEVTVEEHFKFFEWGMFITLKRYFTHVPSGCLQGRGFGPVVIQDIPRNAIAVCGECGGRG